MLSKLIQFSVRNKLIVFLMTAIIVGCGLYSVSHIPIGAVPDITNNQVQVITTSQKLSTQDMEQYVTYPIELELSNLPGVKEIRSISKFGLSVVTVVFHDEVGTYLPRQLIDEKLATVSRTLPKEFGTPQMAPISTGLGEIYQYIVDVKPQYKDKYSIMDLRTIQDWVVKRQLSGIEGVVEVNTWGGYLKQYEVAILPEAINSMNISIRDVFDALEKNNTIAGGGYIEKSGKSYFIRGEGLLSSLQDIENIVVKNMPNGSPIYIKHIAKVQYGSANRFGAITANGQGEKVMGQVMMLKGADSNKVIKAVKDRISSIDKSLPEGVYINTILERSELIGKTMFTVTENLILGCIIVIFVVVLLLGNWRSGLVVASVIPLCLLFALSLMYVFGVDANLMSLGAIDFGIIIDGAVIIVEYISYKITQNSSELLQISSNYQRQKLKDKITIEGSNKMMNSAVFGQLIILIVFIPILTLSAVEGKMFRPMALTFSFALLGAMLFCFTYVPAMSSLFLKPVEHQRKTLSVKIMEFLSKLYVPSINWAMLHKRVVMACSLILLALSGILFSRMGGEFIPTLDEGDFVVQPILKTGTSLGKTIELTTEMEKILKKFPEVKQVVSRIGAAEVPTDPMSMEESDVIVTLIPKSQWVTAKTKDQLASKFKEALSVIPDIEYEFTQPIEMRFNELITGVRADIAVKVFGENLDTLTVISKKIKEQISDIEGVGDLSVEKIDGLPQISVQIDRQRLASYGMNVEDVNEVISMAFGGKTFGNIFEGERFFELVARWEGNYRQNLEDLKNIWVDTPNGYKIPLTQVATISYNQVPAKIFRDNTYRRIVVGVNVRGRDLQSVVDDIEKKMSSLQIPKGYKISYGGQFENLQSATKRLLLAVPVALLGIFFMLYFAFNSLKEAIIIYAAIPFAAVGGVVFLFLRGLPFSISAGVGFIALFGIAVLNGIVLIEHFRELIHKQVYNDINELVCQGAQDRMRAVLLTAMSAALGFFPMAISTGAGAEVQRPLATVVMGGLVTSTMLTLIVLPVLYSVFHSKKLK